MGLRVSWCRVDVGRLGTLHAEKQSREVYPKMGDEGMIAGDLFVYTLMLLNLGAALTYAAQGYYVKAIYWCAVLVLNGCLVKMQ